VHVTADKLVALLIYLLGCNGLPEVPPPVNRQRSHRVDGWRRAAAALLLACVLSIDLARLIICRVLGILAMNPRKSSDHEAQSSSTATWAHLQEHFRLHKLMLDRFQRAGPAAVLRMWRTQTNELGVPLTAFEREALVERHYLLFGVQPRHPSTN